MRGSDGKISVRPLCSCSRKLSQQVALRRALLTYEHDGFETEQSRMSKDTAPSSDTASAPPVSLN